MAYRVRVCCFSDAEGESPCGRWRWDFSELFGPLFLRKNGEPLKNQPMPREPPYRQHPAWVAFEEWQAQSKWARKEATGDSLARSGPGANAEFRCFHKRQSPPKWALKCLTREI